MSVRKAAIVGAGVAGLTAALALARHGIRSVIVEQADRLAAVGAGLQISPNAAHVLDTLGVLPALQAVWLEPDRIDLVSGISLRPLAAVAVGAFARARWGRPYGVLHRATLQTVLLDAVAAQPLCTLVLGHRIDTASPDALGSLCGGRPDVVIGADGVWSAARAAIADAPRARFSGTIAWRTILPDAAVPDFIDRRSVSAFLGPAAHLVCYPLKEVAGINLVAIVSGVDPGRQWSAQASPHRLRNAFGGWNAALRSLVELSQEATVWPLYEALGGRWHNGRDTVLIGDAAHAMMPFAAQGAAMAIEDAFDLAGLVATLPVPQALAAYEERRRPRIDRIRKRGAFNRFVYHARGPVRIARDIALRLRPPQSLAADLDWIYGYRAEG